MASARGDDVVRIASLLPAATEMICRMGLGDRLVAVSHECNWPPPVRRLPRVTRSNVNSEVDSGDIDRQVRRLVESGRALYEVDVAALASCRPDWVITQAQCDVCAISESDARRALQCEPSLRGTQVLTLQPRSIDEMIDDVDRIGAAVGAANSATRFASKLRDRIAQVRRAAAARRHEYAPRVVIIEWTEPLMIAGNWAPGMVRDAGGEYGLVDEGDASRETSWAELLAFAPDVMVVAPCGFDLSRSIREVRKPQQCPEWGELPAVANGQAYVVDGDAYFNRPGPRQVDALEALEWAIWTAAPHLGGSALATASRPPRGWQRCGSRAAQNAD